MNLDCGKCLVRDWSRSDKASLLQHANNRNVARNLTERPTISMNANMPQVARACAAC